MSRQSVFSGNVSIYDYRLEYDCLLSYPTEMTVHYDLLSFKLPIRIYQSNTLVYKGVENLGAIEHLRFWLDWYMSKPTSRYDITDIDLDDDPVLSILWCDGGYRLACDSPNQHLTETTDHQFSESVLQTFIRGLISSFQSKFHRRYQIDIGPLLETFKLLSQRERLKQTALTLRLFDVPLD